MADDKDAKASVDKDAKASTDKAAKASSEGRTLYELMFEDMSPAQFLKAAKKAVTKAKRTPSKCRILLIALLNWVDDNPINFGAETAMGRLTDLILRFDEDDEVDNDDVLVFMDIIRDFLSTITPKDVTSMENWEVPANMSPNLLVLFGKPLAHDERKPVDGKTAGGGTTPRATIDTWKAPSKWGLSNSEPIFVSAKSAAQYITQRDLHSDGDDKLADSGKTTPQAGGDSSPPKAETKSDPQDNGGSTSSLHRHDSKNSRKSGDEGEGDDDSDYDDDDDDYEDEGDDELPKGMNMSLNLMRALGLDTTGMSCDTDWKPPDEVGIEANPDSYKL